MSNSSPDNRPLAWLRFDLWTLAEMVAGVGLAAALLTELEEVGFFLIVLGMAVAALALGRPLKRIETCVVFAVLLLLAVVLLAPSEGVPIVSARRSQCANNLKQIALALHNYHDESGQFPPAVVFDASGKPMHSWRALILPYMGQSAVSKAYDLAQPWDSLQNRLAAAKLVTSEIHCPSDPANLGSRTSYFYVVGPGRLKPGKDTLSLRDVSDGNWDTILVVESSSVTVDWFEPRDLTVDEALKGINPLQGPGISSQNGRASRRTPSRGGVNVAFFSGAVRWLPDTVSQETLRGMLTIDGGEQIEEEFPPYPPPPSRAGQIGWLLALWCAYLGFVVSRHWPRRSQQVMPDASTKRSKTPGRVNSC